MGFLKRLFGGGSSPQKGGSQAGDKVGIYFYVQPRGCEEVVRIRVDRNNDLSLADDGTTYWVRKGVRGAKCRQNAELTLYFDANRRLVTSDVEQGTLVDEAAYEAWVESQTSLQG